MYWQEETPLSQFQVPDSVLDLLFTIECRSLPVDHAHALYQALSRRLPWLESGQLGVHSIHVAGSQNGWERPSQDDGQELLLSRRTKFCLRVPKDRLEEVRRELTGATLDVAGHPLTLGAAKIKPLAKDPTLFARYVAIQDYQDEDRFLTWAVRELDAVGVRVRKALCGKTLSLSTPQGPLAVRSLLLAALPPDEAVRLQERGLGPYRHLGCGIFIPHKGIDPVRQIRDD